MTSSFEEVQRRALKRGQRYIYRVGTEWFTNWREADKRGLPLACFTDGSGWGYAYKPCN